MVVYVIIIIIIIIITSETFPILRRLQVDIINVRPSSRKVSVIFVIFYSNVVFFDRFSKYPQISNFMKIRLVGADLFHADGLTDRQT